MGPSSILSDPDLDWLPAGNRQLLQAAWEIEQGQTAAAVFLAMAVSSKASWLQPLCIRLAQRALQARGTGEVASLRLDGSPEIAADTSPEALLRQVFEQPSQRVHLTTTEVSALRLAALHQRVWNAHVTLELSLEEHVACTADCAVASGLTADVLLLRTATGERVPLNGRERKDSSLERRVRLNLARRWLLDWHPWPWLPQATPGCLAPLPDAELPRHWLEGRTRTRILLIEERRRLNWGLEEGRARERERVSIVIPVWGAGKQLGGCLESLRRLKTPAPLEIILVDNGNQDTATCGVLARAPERDGRVRVLRQPENFGFALGCNLGFSASHGARVLFLNSDAQLATDALPPLLDALDDPSCRAVQPALLTPEGRIQCLGIVFSPLSPLGLALHAGAAPEPALMRPRRLPAVTAACVLLRAAEFAAVQGFDVAYLNGQEDTDLCLRLTERFGGSCAVAPSSLVIHPEGSSPGRYRHLEANRSRLIHRWPSPDRDSLERELQADGLVLTGYRDVDRPDRPRWLQAPQPVVSRAEAWRSRSEGT
jgi:GT2 family glycosyltransferase